MSTFMSQLQFFLANGKLGCCKYARKWHKVSWAFSSDSYWKTTRWEVESWVEKLGEWWDTRGFFWHCHVCYRYKTTTIILATFSIATISFGVRNTLENLFWFMNKNSSVFSRTRPRDLVLKTGQSWCGNRS